MITIVFVLPDGERREVVVPPEGTLMQAAVQNMIPGIIGECGGWCSCGTCHVYVESRWFGLIDDQDEAESAMLEFVEAPEVTSRLSCQIRLRPELSGLVVHIPNSQI